MNAYTALVLVFFGFWAILLCLVLGLGPLLHKMGFRYDRVTKDDGEVYHLLHIPWPRVLGGKKYEGP